MTRVAVDALKYAVAREGWIDESWHATADGGRNEP